jgi:hypothetical protein
MSDDDTIHSGGGTDPAADDPAAPAAGADLSDKARDLANYGAEGPQTFAPAHALAAPTIAVDWGKVQAFLTACQSSHPRVSYGLGAKIPSDSAAPGTGFTKVDCSGFVRAAIRRSTNPKNTAFPDGSVVQHDWIKAKGFERGTIADCKLADGKIRIAFLAPQDAPSGIGHVVLIRNGKTAESHGGVGPDSRAFNGAGWQAKTKVYLLHG